jgi:hypothetical protein
MAKLLTLLVLCALLGGAKAQAPLGFKGLALGALESDVLAKYKRLTCYGTAESRSCSNIRDGRLALGYFQECESEKKLSRDECRTFAATQSGGDTIAGWETRYLSFEFTAGELSTIAMHVDEDGFVDIVNALTAAYGKPSAVGMAMLSNAMGAKFYDRTVVWGRRDGEIVVRRYGANLETTTVRYRSATAIKIDARARANAQKKSNKDL